MPTPWPFTGRSAELAGLADLLAAGASVVLSGTAGVGKSRLAAEAVGCADALRVSATVPDLPLGALSPLLPAVPPEGNVLAWAADAIAGSGRVLLLVDDAHRLDATSATLVHQLVAAGRAQLVATVRTGEPCPDAIVSLWKDELAERVDVGPLTYVHALLERVLGGPVERDAADRLAELTRGNALYLRELVAAGALRLDDGRWRWAGRLTLPRRLSELIELRIGTLAEPERAALELAALGEPLGLDMLVRLAGAGAVENLEERGLITVIGDRRRQAVRLSHPLYGEAVRAGTPRLRTMRRLRELAGAVESTGARRRDDVLRLAVWRLDSGSATDPEPLLAALRLAWAVADYPLAERLGRAAVEAGGGPEAGLLLGTVLGYAGRPEEAAEILRSTWEQECEERTRALLATTLGRTLGQLGRLAEAERLLEDAAVMVDDLENLQEITLMRTMFTMAAGRYTATAELAATILARPGNPGLAVQAHVTTAWALLFTGRPLDALESVDRAIGLGTAWREEIPVLVMSMNFIRIHAATLIGDLDLCRSAAAEIGAIGTETWEAARFGHQWAEGVAALMAGRVREAVELLRPAPPVLPDRVDSINRADLALAAGLAGDVALAGRALAEAEAIPPATPIHQTMIDLARPWLTGSAAEALRAAALAGERGLPGLEVLALHTAVRLGDRSPATAHRLAELAGLCQGRLAELAALHAAAVHHGRDLMAVAEEFAGAGLLLHAAEAAAQAAGAFAEAGRQASARAASARAWALSRECRGAATPALARLAAPALTKRELEIARLAAAGHSSKEIADRLVLSPRTVDNHLQAAFGKLGVSGRGDLGPLLGQ
ncbi:helix-turn-helix domain-containing protein [Nonomuraea soli]|uniref:DNA-binding CsgD family transcriptional regulator n=1 Tax=Nonomuraea soli TaxID=1032476 RepID=A0A7W0CTS3_9ACTN|nr:helix-turn-helix transcriptional regulator [Nonomuraea soli]MBA2897212.1 DNA-binding CsgD family transcriptional regulator [Nonomuraea soli]